MGFLKRLLGGSADEGAGSETGDRGAMLEASEATFELHGDRHRVSVWLRLANPTLESEREQIRVFTLEDRLMRAVDAAGTGEHDTNALEGGFLAIRLVGPDADAIVSTILPLLDDAPAGSYLAIRRGPSGAAEDKLDLAPRS